MTGFPFRIGYQEALAIVHREAAGRALPEERVSLARAEGRILSRDVVAPLGLPAFDNSRMDGFAVRHADLPPHAATRLRLAGEQCAGLAVATPLQLGQCVRITTGAPLPAGADTVVVKEDAREADGWVEIPAGIRAGTDIRTAGEDVRAGERVLLAGTVLTPVRASLAAALGAADVVALRRPTVAVFTTGDELVEPGLPLQAGQVYNSNRQLLMALLRSEGLEPVAWPTLADDPLRIEAALRDAATAFDLIITCGGVSVGEKDHLPALLQKHGQVHFWKVRMKPGMPVIFAGLGDALVLGLPGNPVSVLATFLTLGRALLDSVQSRTETRPRIHARLAAPWKKSHERLEFLRGSLLYGEDATLLVQPNPADASHRLRAAADSDALIVLGEGARDYRAGDVVEVVQY